MDKFTLTNIALKKYFNGSVIINHSPATSYRSRCEFGYQNNHYIMHDVKGKKKYLEYFDIARPCIANLMPQILIEINRDDLIKTKLFQINYRCNSNNEVMVSFVYHKKITDELKIRANEISLKFNIQLIIRARKEFYCSRADLLVDTIDGINITLYQTDQSFYQPNHFMMPRMVQKVIQMIKKPKDL